MGQIDGGIGQEAWQSEPQSHVSATREHTCQPNVWADNSAVLVGRGSKSEATGHPGRRQAGGDGGQTGVADPLRCGSAATMPLVQLSV